MSENVSIVGLSVRLILSVILTLVLVFGWAAAAYAQSPAETQYSSSTASGEAAITASDVSSASGASEVAAAAGITALPSTGGLAVLPIAGLATLMLGAAGLVTLRRTNNR